MDRKNKKAAQLAAQAQNAGHANNSGGGGAEKEKKRGGKGANSTKERPSKAPGNLTATAPPSSKASPQVQHDTPNKSTATGNNSLSPPPGAPKPTHENTASPTVNLSTPTTTQPPQGIPDAYRSPMTKRFSSGRPGSSDLGYGPIGSPPNASQISNANSNQYAQGMRSPYAGHTSHFSPGTSPNAAGIQPSTSPFAQQQPVFGAFRSPNAPNANPVDSNCTSSPNVGQGGESARPPIAINRSFRSPIPLSHQRDPENAVASDDDFEEFLPSSLNDLLTPEERQRRASRSGGQRLGNVGLGDNASGASVGGGVGIGGNGLVVGSFGTGHRYSRSVPAVRLLDAHAPSPWKDDHTHDRDPTNLSVASLSFRSAGLGSDGAGFSPNGGGVQLATSNASGAFLAHHHGHGHFTRPSQGITTATSHLTRQMATSQSYEESADVLNSMPTPTALASRGGFGGFNNSSNSGHGYGGLHPGAARGLQNLEAGILSPSSKALQAHAPGQSLPQGLAAGLSRLHLVPGTGGGANGKLSGTGAENKTGSSVRSPLRGGFAMGASPDTGGQGKYGLAALSSSPGVRTGWGQPPSSLSQQLAQHQQGQNSLLTQSLQGPGASNSQGRAEGLGSDPLVSAPIPVRAGMGVGGIAGLATHTPGTGVKTGDTEDGLFALDI